METGIRNKYYTIRQFQGRMNRKNYIINRLIIVVGIISTLALFPLFGWGNFQLGTHIVFLVHLIILLILFVFIIAHDIRRCHDFNITGWILILFYTVPLIGLALFFIKGTEGNNKYGQQSKEEKTIESFFHTNYIHNQ